MSHCSTSSMNRCCMSPTDDVFFCAETAYIEIISARPKGRAPSYPEPGIAGPFIFGTAPMTDILMPALSPTMEEGVLAKWHVKVGDVVKAGDVIAEIETDKATMEFEAIDEGVIGELMVAEGTEGVKVGTVIATITGEGEEVAPVAPAPAPVVAAPPPPAPVAVVTAPVVSSVV
eukprot:gene8035-10726_t